jgi:hypothetical protein
MKNEIEALVNAEIVELNEIIEDRLRIPDAIFRQHGLSPFSIELYETVIEEGMEVEGVEPIQELEQARLSFDALCDSAPHAPRKAIELVSFAYAMLGQMFDPRNTTYDGDLSAVKSLMVASMAKGMAMGIIASDPITSEKDRKKMLSVAGLMGATKRHSLTTELKDWARKQAETVRGAHKDVAAHCVHKYLHI